MFTAKQKSLLSKEIERKRELGYGPLFKKGGKGEVENLRVKDVQLLNFKNELKVRNKVINELMKHADHSKEIVPQQKILCHLAKAFLAMQTHIIQIEEVWEEMVSYVGQEERIELFVSVVGLTARLLDSGATVEEADRFNKFVCPKYLRPFLVLGDGQQEFDFIRCSSIQVIDIIKKEEGEGGQQQQSDMEEVDKDLPTQMIIPRLAFFRDENKSKKLPKEIFGYLENEARLFQLIEASDSKGVASPVSSSSSSSFTSSSSSSASKKPPAAAPAKPDLLVGSRKRKATTPVKGAGMRGNKRTKSSSSSSSAVATSSSSEKSGSTLEEMAELASKEEFDTEDLFGEGDEDRDAVLFELQ